MASTRLTDDRGDLRGLLIPDTRISLATIDADNSSYTEEGPRPGTAVPEDELSRVVLQASGDQSDDLVVKVLQAGMPRLSRGVRVGYRLESEGATKLRGWNAPNLLQRWTAVEYSASPSWVWLDCIVLPSQDVLIAYSDTTSATYIAVFDPTADGIVSTTDFPFDCQEGFALAQLADGRILAVTRRYHATITSQAYWTAQYSEDDGDSWDEWSRNMFDTDPDGDADRSRLFVMPNGDIMYLHLTDGRVQQFASSDMGTTFTLVVDWDTDGAAVPDAILTASGKIMIVYTDVDDDPNIKVLGSAWESVEDATAIEVTTTDSDEVWGLADPSGRNYVYRRVQGLDTIEVYASDDDGDTWTRLLYGVGSNVSADTYITGGRIVHAGGTAWWLHQFETSASSFALSIGLLGLGGWSNVTMESAGEGSMADHEIGRLAYGQGADWVPAYWLPFDAPSGTTGWTAVGAGSYGVVSGGDYVRITTTANTRYAEKTTTPGTDTSADFLLDFRVTVGGSLTAPDAGARIQLSDGTNSWAIQICATTTQFAVYDIVAAATLATVTTGVTSEFVQIWVHFEANNRLEVYWRLPTSATWTSALQDADTSTTPSAASHFYWGNVSSGTTTSEWRLVAVTHATDRAWWATPLSEDGAFDRNLCTGRLMSGLPVPLYDRATSGDGTTYLAAVDGPGVVDERHDIPVAHDYPIDAIHWQVQPSPRVRHRTTSTASDLILAWEPDGNYDTGLGGRSYGLAALGCNWRTATFEGSTNSGSSWTTLGTMDLATGFTGLSFTLAASSDIVRIDSGSAAATRYVWRNELVGASIDLGGGVVRKILAHQEGIWSTANGKHVELQIDLQGGEPTSGTCAIIAHSGVLVVHNVSTLYDTFRVKVASQTTADGYFETGNLVIGSVQPIGQAWDWNWTKQRTPNAETIRDRSGVARVRALGPARDSLSLNWAQGVDISRLRDSSPTPDWVGDGASSSEGLANWQDAPYLLAGLLEELRSGETPVVVLANISTTSGTTITDPTLYLWSRIASTVTLESVVGNEGESEVLRVGQVTFEGL